MDGREEADQATDAGLDQCNAGGFERLHEAAGEADGHAVLHPGLLAAAGDEPQRRRRRRAPARDPAVRLRAGDDGGGGADGRGGRRRPRRPELRLPRQEGHEDGRRGDAARRSRSRGAHRLRHRGGRRPPGHREAPPGAPRRVARLPRRRAASRRGRSGVLDAASALRAADVHGLRRPRAHRRARFARRRARHRLGRHRLAREGADGARDDRRVGRDGRPCRAGQSLGARRDRRRRGAGALARGGRRRAGPLHPRDRPRARRAPRQRVPEEVLRLVPRPRALPAAVQAGARRPRRDGRGRAPADRGRPGSLELIERLEAEVPSGDDVTLELPISIYGGG